MSDDTTETSADVGEKVLQLPSFSDVRIIDASEIRSLLPHRGIQLLLEKVKIYNDRVVGSFEVIAGCCPGFPIISGRNLIIRGSDVIDVSAQTLGIAGSLIPELRRKRSFVLAKVGVAKFYIPIRAGEIVEIEIPRENIKVIKKVQGEDDQYILRARGIVVKVSGDRRATISSILLISTLVGEEECLTAFERRHQNKKV